MSLEKIEKTQLLIDIIMDSFISIAKIVMFLGLAYMFFNADLTINYNNQEKEQEVINE